MPRAVPHAAMDDATAFATAMQQAHSAAQRGEVPVGAVVVHAPTGQIVGAAGNEVEALHDVSAHAEILAMRRAAQHLGDTRLPECDLFVTLEPCAMCAAAISFARIRRVVFGAYDPKTGGVEHGARFFSQPTCHHSPQVVSGYREAEAAMLLRTFFEARR
jgi:tRNA(adenine34) deaminase